MLPVLFNTMRAQAQSAGQGRRESRCPAEKACAHAMT